MRLIYFGTRSHGLECLERIIAAGHRVLAVTSQDYHMDEVSADDFAALCARHGIVFFREDRIETPAWRERYAALGADLGVCVGWRRLVGPLILSTTRHGFIGPHGADLPRYRGFAATHRAILNGDPACGFCLMRFKPGAADNGDIVSRFSVPLGERDTIADLMARARPLVIAHILQALADLEARGELAATPQDESRAVLSYPRRPEDGELDWARPALELDRLVRAVTRPYPGAFTYFEGRRLFVWRARVMAHPPQWVGEPGHLVHLDGAVGALTGRGILLLDECQLEGGEPFAPREFFRGHRLRLGMRPALEITALRRRVEALEAELRELKARLAQPA